MGPMRRPDRGVAWTASGEVRGTPTLLIKGSHSTGSYDVDAASTDFLDCVRVGLAITLRLVRDAKGHDLPMLLDV